ncbi:uncharacterized protein KNAG_0E03920 [Huiozyma naganishii CBS 8797]|uniref:Uncharacterized protein n=1 Tax=Huiozyma naganishii (strain ATCC MYA-139 / BCRC 22969 / CBS 8797 / KCTC 17520 / NBRC 10181 / NCYC 3082 / Yp74L-3) TaxID=1071383 RepID=J7S823_HUIN7|nr:hypothetical protein KNAG_0E03920 [Kazachstania naganishii CBS 8797]CCK70646.1 hypothetical protein KNAG_0E03920 [Kazachstania naganishii CBS 8797]
MSTPAPAAKPSPQQNGTPEVHLAERQLHEMSIEEQKDLYGNEDTLNRYFVNLAGRIRDSVATGYLLPERT